jgi:signal recognition particle subunit SEC65
MNREQTNRITELQSALNEIRHKAIEELSTKLNLTMNKIVEASDDPKKDGEENFRKLDDLKEEFKKELKEVFEKFDKKLNSL